MSTPNPVQITTRPVRPDDQDFLYDLYAQSRYDFQLVDWPSEETREAMTRMQFDAQRTHYKTHYPASEHAVILRTDGPKSVRVGRVWTAYQDDCILILDMNILPKHQSRGIGTHLINVRKNEAREAKLPLRHHVETDNHDAMRLYKRLGFRVVQTHGSHHLMEWRPEVLRTISS